MIKQLNLFSKPVKVTPSKKPLEEEQFVPLDKSVFGLSKLKQRKQQESPVITVDEQLNDDLNIKHLHIKYKNRYIMTYNWHLRRGTLLEPEIFNRCCVLLEESYEGKPSYNFIIGSVKPVYDYIKDIIVCVPENPVDLLYCYSFTQKDIIDFVTEAYGLSVEEAIIIIDKVYADVFVELGGRFNGKDRKKC